MARTPPYANMANTPPPAVGKKNRKKSQTAVFPWFSTPARVSAPARFSAPHKTSNFDKPLFELAPLTRIIYQSDSKPDHQRPGQKPGAIFLMGEFPTPWAKRVQNPHPRAYKNELKPDPGGIVLNYSS